MTIKLPPWGLETVTDVVAHRAVFRAIYMVRENDFVSYCGNHVTGTSWFPL